MNQKSTFRMICDRIRKVFFILLFLCYFFCFFLFFLLCLLISQVRCGIIQRMQSLSAQLR